MKTEPTAATAASIYRIMDLELQDLTISPGEDAFSSVRSAIGLSEGAAGELLDELNIVIHEMNAAKEADQEILHRHFNNMYHAAINAAGRSVRLAAMARLAIINSDTMRKYDFADPGVKYGQQDT